MPTYEYECDGCGHKFELFQSITESNKKKCPECKKNKLRRLFGTGAAIVFKGSGFYETDYRSESYKEGKKKAEDSKKESKEKKSESKKSDSTTKSSTNSNSSSTNASSSKKKSD